MANVNDLETTIGGWYKNVPHLPKNGQKWLADNVWWLALIGAVLSVLGLVTVIPLLLSVLALSSAVVSTASVYSSGYTGYGGLFWLSLIVSLVSYIATTVLLIMSVNPLKAQTKRGWRLLFWSYLVNFALAVVSAVISFTFFGIVSALISAAIGGYFLFEIHGYFVSKQKVTAKASTKTTAK